MRTSAAGLQLFGPVAVEKDFLPLTPLLSLPHRPDDRGEEAEKRLFLRWQSQVTVAKSPCSLPRLSPTGEERRDEGDVQP